LRHGFNIKREVACSMAGGKGAGDETERKDESPWTAARKEKKKGGGGGRERAFPGAHGIRFPVMQKEKGSGGSALFLFTEMRGEERVRGGEKRHAGGLPDVEEDDDDMKGRGEEKKKKKKGGGDNERSHSLLS